MSIYDDLITDEGLRLKPYIDSVGKFTIGVGRNLTDRGLSEREAMYLFINDVADAKEDLYRALPWTKTLDFPAQNVLVNMTFNLGILRLLDFKKFLAALQKGDRKTARLEMLDSRWAKQVGVRALRLADVIYKEDA